MKCNDGMCGAEDCERCGCPEEIEEQDGYDQYEERENDRDWRDSLLDRGDSVW